MRDIIIYREHERDKLETFNDILEKAQKANLSFSYSMYYNDWIVIEDSVVIKFYIGNIHRMHGISYVKYDSDTFEASRFLEMHNCERLDICTDLFSSIVAYLNECSNMKD